MNNQDKQIESAANLRRAAEKALRAKELGIPEDISTLSPEKIQASLHELHMHQIELEMQNEELHRAQLELSASRARYFDLYDLAPVGYITLSDKGVILQANLTAAAQLGVKRGDLTARTLSRFILKEDQDIFYLLRRQLMQTKQPQTGELRMLKKDGSFFWAQVEATGVQLEELESDSYLGTGGLPKYDLLQFRIVLVDISERKQKEQTLREAKWRLESIIEGTQAGTWEWNVQTGETVFNEKWAQIVGYTLAELAPISIKTWERLFHPDDLLQSNELLAQHFAGELPYYDYESRMKHKDGHWVWVHDRGRLVTRSADGRPALMFGTHIDITQHKQTEEALKESNQRFTKMFENHDSIMLLIEPQTGSILDANQAAAKFYGYNKSQLLALTIADINLLPPDQVASELQKAWASKKNYFVFPHKLASGEERIVEVHSSRIILPNDKQVLFSIIHDITERMRMEDKLKSTSIELQNSVLREHQLARTDVLTGVNNRRSLFEQAAQHLEVALRYHQPLSVMMFDLDHFKNINDIYGHAVGDLFLQRVTQIACEEIRSADVIGRYGGEEFVISMPMTSVLDAYPLAERIRTKVEGLRIPTEKGDAAVTLSIGISEVNPDTPTQSVDALISSADMAMYMVKQTGRNRTKIAGFKTATLSSGETPPSCQKLRQHINTPPTF
jgi:diguanylate cyclase (GGDEF)-like protein/PAS domain S-box-containing protein